MERRFLFLLFAVFVISCVADDFQCNNGYAGNLINDYTNIGNATIPEFTISSELPRVLLEDDNEVEDAARIYNGDRTDDEQFPYSVFMQCWGPTSINYCGGSILSEDIIMTAAHCLVGKWYCLIGYGSNYIKEMIKVEATHFFIHPLYNKSLLLHDIALIGLTCENKIQFNDTKRVGHVTLPKKCDSYDNKTAVVAGFGETQKGANMVSNWLRFVEIKVLSFVECFKTWTALMTPTKICATGINNKTEKSTCRGDSGSALVQIEGKKFLQIGLVSFGSANCGTKYAVFTKISAYLDFISYTIKEFHRIIKRETVAEFYNNVSP